MGVVIKESKNLLMMICFKMYKTEIMVENCSNGLIYFIDKVIFIFVIDKVTLKLVK